MFGDLGCRDLGFEDLGVLGHRVKGIGFRV